MKKRLSLKTQFKIEFLLLFTGSRKMLEKMPEGVEHRCRTPGYMEQDNWSRTLSSGN